MAEGGTGFDTSKLTTADKLVLGGAGIFFIWSFLPFWYRFSLDLGVLGGVSDSIGGFRGVTLIAALLALVAIIEVGASKLAGANLALPVKRGLVHLAVAVLGLLFTVLGLVSKPTGYGISWGIFVALVLALVWAYGAYMMYSEPEAAAPPPGGMEGGPTA